MYLAHKYIGTYESIMKCEMNNVRNPTINSIAEKLNKSINGINPKEVVLYNTCKYHLTKEFVISYIDLDREDSMVKLTMKVVLNEPRQEVPFVLTF